MNTTGQIRQLDQEIADAEHAVEATVALRAARDKLQAAELAAEEARRCARAAEEAAAAVTDAEHDARRAEVGPLQAELAEIEQQLAAADAAARGQLQKAVEACRELHAERERLVQQHDHLRGKLSAHQEWFQRVNPLNLAAFIRQHLAHVVG